MQLAELLGPLPLAGAIGLFICLGLAGWLLVGRGPRNRRLYRRLSRLVEQHQWQAALPILQARPPSKHALDPWDRRFQTLAIACHEDAGRQALADEQLEQALDHRLEAAKLSAADSESVRQRVRDDMLSVLRRRYAENGDVAALGQGIATLFGPCGEAGFWQALDCVRRGEVSAAIDHLHDAQSAEPTILEPLLYLGALLLRQHQAEQAVPLLRKAETIAPNCALVAWQLGLALAMVGQDVSQALALLQRSVGAEGLPRWRMEPQQLWTKGLADSMHSFVARLAGEHDFRCPVFGSDIAAMIQQARLALARAHERLGQVAVLRGLSASPSSRSAGGG